MEYDVWFWIADSLAETQRSFAILVFSEER